MKSNAGFTLVELLIAIALIGVVGVIAIPNFISFLPDYRLKAAAQDLMANFQKAKLTAVERNTDTAVTFTGTGYRIFVDSKSPFFVYQTGEDIVIEVDWADYKSVSEGTNNFDNTSGQPCIAFRPSGVPKDGSATGNVASGDVTLNNTNGKSMTVEVTVAGGVRIQ